jgi:hypothetical protein
VTAPTPENDRPEPSAAVEASVMGHAGVERLVASLAEVVQTLSEGQRDQVEVVTRLVDAIDNLTLAHAALHDELARLRAEAGSAGIGPLAPPR